MTNTTTESASSLITLLPEGRDQNRRLIVSATPAAGGEGFRRSFWPRDREEIREYLEALCAQFPGIGPADKSELRGRITRIAKSQRIDIVVHPPHGPINGSARCSIDYYAGGKLAWSTSGNLLSAKFRGDIAAHIARLESGREAKQKAIDSLAEEIKTLLIEQIHLLRHQPASPQRLADHPDDVPYTFSDGVIYWRRKLMQGDVPTRLTNFTARIVTNVVRSDGVDRDQQIEIEGAIRGQSPRRFTISSADFEKMAWPVEQLGPQAVIEPEEGYARRTKVAIQKLSTEISHKVIYTHTGWIKEDGAWFYLHAGGAIGPANRAFSVDVALEGPLVHYHLPAPPEGADLIKAIRASLRITELGPATIVYPVYCTIFRSILKRSPFTVHLVGGSGVFKSEAEALALQHFGPEMNAENLTAGWVDSTENSLREILFLAKDALSIFDDYKLEGNKTDEPLKKKTDGVIRGSANGAGRQRMKAEGGLRSSHPPRGTILSSGEQIPGKHSCRARMLIVEVPPNSIRGGDWLGSFQKDARDGLYAAATAGFIRWLADDARIERIRQELIELIPKLRSRAESESVHRRTPGIVADLYAGLWYWIQFAQEKGAIDAVDSKRLQDDAWGALMRVSERQREYQEATDPAARYVELLDAALSSGEAHLAGRDGNHPGDELAAACGWWKETATGNWQRQGLLIGYLTDEAIALLPDPTLKALQRAAGTGDEGPVGSERDLRKRLYEKGLLIVDRDQKFQRLTVRRQLNGKLRTVLLLRSDAISLSGARSARNDPDPADLSFDFEPETAAGG